MSTIEKIILFEYDLPINRSDLINYEAGIWYWKITNEVDSFTDPRGVTGYYRYRNSTVYNIKSFRYGETVYSKTISLDDCRDTNQSFYYDPVTTLIYIHFDSFDPPLEQMYFGAAFGYSKMPYVSNGVYYNEFYYAPMISNVSSLKKEIDPLFFGILKYFTAQVTLINSSGEFDDWRSRNVFGQPARILIGEVDDEYNDFDTVVEGFISDDSRTFDQFTIMLEDPRRNLTQPVAQNTLNKTDWPSMQNSDVGKAKPVAYGEVFNAPSICLNEAETSPIYRTFLICDTQYNNIDSLDTIYVDGTATALTGSVDLNAGTFTMTSVSVADNLGSVTIDFTAGTITNAVNIIKDLMLNYDAKPFNASFWDLTEVNEAETLSRDTSLYISDGSLKLNEAIEKVAVDSDARFFIKNNGVFTIRLYDKNRDPNNEEIKKDSWLEYPEIKNNGSEYLTSAIIKYKPDISTGEYLIYENTYYRDQVFLTYKKYKVEEFETSIPTLADAADKSETIMQISKEVQDIITRPVNWDFFGVEPGDFVIGSARTRDTEDENREVYEVLGVSHNLDSFNIYLNLRYVKDADPLPVYSSIDDNNDIPILDNNNFNLIGRVS